MKTESLEKEYNTNKRYGLTSEEATRRLREDGENAIVKDKPTSYLAMFLEQLNEPMIFVLFVAAAISLLLRDYSDTAIVLVVILLNATVGVVQEGKARKALEALEQMTAPRAYVKRDQVFQEIPSSQLVKGDIVRLEMGNQVPADLILIESGGVEVDESALTGESVGVYKEMGKEIYMSTQVLKGQGEGMVVSCGMDTKLGKIASMIHETKKEETPLQKRMGHLGKVLSLIAVGVCFVLFILGLCKHQPVGQMLLTSISLAVAAVPEGLPAIITIVLALGVMEMAKKNAIVRKLPAVETLGCVDVVCSDKTGTLTQNEMTVVSCYTNGRFYKAQEMDKESQKVLLEGFTLCNDAAEDEGGFLGSSTEVALLKLGKKYGFHKGHLEKRIPRKDEISFDSKRKYMVTLHKDKEEHTLYMKGACDVVLEKCNKILLNGEVKTLDVSHRKEILLSMDSMAKEALRVLALAYRQCSGVIKEEGYIFIGLVGMMDPPRQGVKGAIEKLHSAGVSVAMITGDYKETAFAIAKQLGIAKDKKECISGKELDRVPTDELARDIEKYKVFARVTPEHKVKIVEAFKMKDHLAAMTGDGVNDAPALRRASIGIAMGRGGTDVAKNAADMILTDDDFTTIERAVEAGRGIYANIQKTILFLLSSNFGEIITMFTAMLLGLGTPLKASHILWVNLITDALPALALGVDKNDTKLLMNQPPRKTKSSLFSNGGWFLTVFYGCVIAAISLGAFWMGVGEAGGSIARGQTYAFTVLGVSQLFHAIGMRNTDKSLFSMNHNDNVWMVFAVLLGIILQVAVTSIPTLITAFGTVPLGLQQWGKLMGLCCVPMIVHEILCLLKKLTRKKEENKR